MTMMISLNDELGARLASRAKQQQLSVEQFAIRVLTEAVANSESIAPREAAASNSLHVRRATEDLADLLRAAPADPGFDLDGWNRQWSSVEAEMTAVTRANDMAEGRGMPNALSR